MDEVFGLINKWTGDIARAALYTPAAVYDVTKGVGGDVNQALHGDPSFDDTRRIGGAIVHGVAQDFRHPIRNLPFLALDLASLATGGAGLAARTAAVGRTLEAARVADTAIKASAVTRALLKTPPPGQRLLHIPGYVAEQEMVKQRHVPGVYGGAGSHELYRTPVFRDPQGARMTVEDAKAMGPAMAVQGLYSANPAVRAIQRLRDTGQNLHPERGGLSYALPSNFGPLAGHELRLPGVVRSRKTLALHYQSEAERIMNRLEIADGTREASAQLKHRVAEAADAINQATTMGMLYLKPAYTLPNLLGQVALTLVHHHFNPIELKRSVRMQRELLGGDTEWTGAVGRKAAAQIPGYTGQLADVFPRIRAIMGDTIYEAINPGTGKGSHRSSIAAGISETHGAFSKVYSKILDSPFRDAAFFYEARRAGFHTTDDIRRLIEDESLRGQLVDVGMRANRALIDYTRLGKTERNVIRRVVFFYPWVKGATMYAGHFMKEHTFQAAVQANAGSYEAKRASDELGAIPSFLTGSFKVGERNVPGLGKVPLVANPASASILGTPAQVLETGRGLALGNTTQFGQLSEFLNPAVTTLGEATFRVDPFTGQRIPSTESVIDIAKKSYAPEKFPLGRVLGPRGAGVFGENLTQADKSKFLYPTTPADEANRFLIGGLAARPLNPVQASAKARAEKREQLAPDQRVKESHAFYRGELAKAAASSGVAHNGQLPKQVVTALGLRQYRFAALAKAKQAAGSNLDATGRLETDLALLVKLKKMRPAEAAQLRRQLHGAPDPVIDGVRGRLAPLFGTSVLSAYARAIRARGGTPPSLPKS